MEKGKKWVYGLNMKRGDISGKHKRAFRIYPLLSDGRCNYPSKKVRKYLLTFLWPHRESNPGLRRERASSWPLDHEAEIEATRFELATSASRTQRSTKLSHASMFLSVCFALFTSDLYILSWLRKKCKRFLKKMQIFKTNFPECGKKPGKALFYAGKWHFRLSGGSIS